MKKTVAFEAFGKADYLMLDIEKMARAEQVTGLAMAELFDLLRDGKFGVLKLMQVLPIALADCRHVDNITAEMEKALKNGCPIMAMCAPLLMAIIETGIFGELGKLKAQKSAEATDTATDQS